MTYSYRRAYVRFPAEVSAQINTGKAKGIVTILTDLSAGGAGFISHVPFETSEKVDILIKPCYLFKEDVIKTARVAWCRKSGYDLWQTGLDFGMDNLMMFS